MPIQKIQRGLFKFDIYDYHAILGVPIDEDPEKIRKRYLQVIRRFHPDLRRLQGKAEEKLADGILSKLVNPAYESLVKDQSQYKEHRLLLTQIGNQVAQEGLPAIESQVAKDLARAGEKLEIVYRDALKTLAEQQYEQMNLALEKIAQLSELNLVYLVQRQGAKRQSQKASADTTVAQPAPRTQPPATVVPKLDKQSDLPASSTPQEQKPSLVDPYLRRAKTYISKNIYAKAILELRDALGLDPKNGEIHSLLGYAYLKQNQLGMAKVHINKALQITPQDPIAKEAQKSLEQLTQPGRGKAAGNNNRDAGSSPRRGILGGLFGGGRKKK